MFKRFGVVVFVCMCVLSFGVAFTVSPAWANNVEINETNFPDANFRSALLAATKQDTTIPSIENITNFTIGETSITFGTATTADQYNAQGLDSDSNDKITTLKGIELFTGLTTIEINGLAALEENIEFTNHSGTFTSVKALNCPKLHIIDLGNQTTPEKIEVASHISVIYSNAQRYAPKFHSKVLMLSGKLGLYFYMKLPVNPDATGETDDAQFKTLYDESKMTFTIKEGTSDSYTDLNVVTFNEAETMTVTEDEKEITLYGFKCSLTSAQTADTIKAVFSYTDVSNTESYVTVEQTYTLPTYLNAITASGSGFGTHTVELANAIKDYGYYVQQALKEQYGSKWNHTDMTPATESLTAIEASTVSDYALNETDSNSKLTTSYTLVLDSDTTLEVYLTPEGGATISSAEVDGKEYAVGTANTDGNYVISIQNIPAHELNKAHAINITSSAGTLAITNLSALSYAHKVLGMSDKVTSEVDNTVGNVKVSTLKKAVTAIYNYYIKTKAFRDSDEFRLYN